MKNRRNEPFRLLFYIVLFVLCLFLVSSTSFAAAKPPKSDAKSKFYDFNEQLIDGEIKKPTNLYLDARKRVKFGRLLRLKKSFMRDLMMTARERVFK